MQISFTNTQNFEGAYRIKPQEIKAKAEIPALFTQGRQIFHDILEKGDEVIVLRNQYDRRVGKYIKENNLTGIEYYPTINTKSGLDDEKPELLIALIKDKATKVITDIKEICSISAKQKKAPKPPKSVKALEKIANTLRLNIERPKVLSTPEVTRIRDKEKQRTIEVIMQNKGNSYVYLIPDSPYGDYVRCIIDNKGNVMKRFETPDEIRAFNQKFHKLKQQKVNILV